jgi:hypothetical protein
MEGKILPMTAKAEGQLFANLGLSKLNEIVQLVPEKEGRTEIKDRIIKGAFKTQEGKALRFHTITTLSGRREIQSVQSTKFDAINELEVLESAEAATAEFGMIPFNFSYDEDRSFLQLIRLDQKIELPNMDNTGRDKVHGMITIKISPVEANTVEAGWFQRYCTNGQIFGGDTELSIKATRTQGLSLEHILPGLIKGIMAKQDTTGIKMKKMYEQAFTDLPYIEEMYSNNNLKRIFDTYIEHELREVEAVRGSRARARDILSSKAHTVDIEPHRQMIMEKIAGSYILATKV